jgi:hypothetical protein
MKPIWSGVVGAQIDALMALPTGLSEDICGRKSDWRAPRDGRLWTAKSFRRRTTRACGDAVQGGIRGRTPTAFGIGLLVGHANVFGISGPFGIPLADEVWVSAACGVAATASSRCSCLSCARPQRLRHRSSNPGLRGCRCATRPGVPSMKASA